MRLLKGCIYTEYDKWLNWFNIENCVVSVAFIDLNFFIYYLNVAKGYIAFLIQFSMNSFLILKQNDWNKMNLNKQNVNHIIALPLRQNNLWNPVPRWWTGSDCFWIKTASPDFFWSGKGLFMIKLIKTMDRSPDSDALRHKYVHVTFLKFLHHGTFECIKMLNFLIDSNVHQLIS